MTATTLLQTDEVEKYNLAKQTALIIKRADVQGNSFLNERVHEASLGTGLGTELVSLMDQ